MSDSGGRNGARSPPSSSTPIWKDLGGGVRVYSQGREGHGLACVCMCLCTGPAKACAVQRCSGATRVRKPMHTRRRCSTWAGQGAHFMSSSRLSFFSASHAAAALYRSLASNCLRACCSAAPACSNGDARGGVVPLAIYKSKTTPPPVLFLKFQICALHGSQLAVIRAAAAGWVWEGSPSRKSGGAADVRCACAGVMQPSLCAPLESALVMARAHTAAAGCDTCEYA